MRKIISFTILALLIAAFCACGDGTDESSLSVSTSSGTESAYESSVVADESSLSDSLPESSLDESAESESVSEETSQELSEAVSEDISEEESTEISEEESKEESEEESKEESEEESQPIEESDPPEESIPPEESTPPEESEDEKVYTDIGDAELLDSGYLIYDGAAYTNTYYSPTYSPKYADVYARYAQLFPETDITVINPPLGAINILNPLVRDMVRDQGEVLDKIEKDIYGGVNFVNLKETFVAHRGEYLYFKSDYHWTQLGAYYAYCEYAKSKGWTPTPLSEFEKVTVTESFIGHSNDYANDPKDRIKNFVDTVYAYMPRKAHTMKIYDANLNLYKAYDNCIQLDIKNYSCFTCGDNAYMVIDVPENDPEKVAVVIKESSANAFVPFLTEHYGKIIVIDPRPFNGNFQKVDMHKLVPNEGVDEVIFFAMASTVSRSGYDEYYRKMIGE